MKFLSLLVTLFSIYISFSQTYQSAESVEWDETNNRWLVANGSNIIIDDGNNNLSFFGDASASHGMEIIGNVLFAIDSNVIKGYQLSDASEVMSLSIPGVSFLNGMGSNINNDMLYVTDFGANKIYSVDVSDVSNPTFVEIVSNTIDTPNGILFSPLTQNLYFVTWGSNGKVKEVDLNTNLVTDVATDLGLGNIDGIIYNNIVGNYVISSWSPNQLTELSQDFSISWIYETPQLNSPADIGFRDLSAGYAGIPMGNEVVFFDLFWEVGVDEFELSEIEFKISENPIQENSYIDFTLNDVSKMNIDLYDMQGKKVASLLNANNISGYQKMELPFSTMATGVYFLKIKMNNKQQSLKIIKK